jgi:hypothetical protein
MDEELNYFSSKKKISFGSFSFFDYLFIEEPSNGQQSPFRTLAKAKHF